MSIKTKPGKRKDEDEEEEEEKDEEEEETEEEDEDEEEDEEEEKEDEDEEDEEDEDSDEDEDKDEDPDESDEDEEDAKPKGGKSWKVVGAEAQKKLVAKAEAIRASSSRREVWLKDGDTKKFRFMTKEPLAMLVQHSLPRKIKGKMMYPKYTCTQDDDCQFCARGVPASISAVYEVHNFEKFTKKDGTEIEVDTRFYVVPESRSRVIQKVLANCKPKSSEWIIEVERMGTGQKTSYVYLPLKKKPLTDAELKLKSIADTFDAAYAPLPLKEQKIALGAANLEGDGNDD